MENITFKSQKLEKLYNSYKDLSKAYWPQNAQKIIKRLNQLKASPSLKEMHFDRPHELKWKMKWIFAVDVEHPFRLLFEPIWDYDPSDLGTIINIQINDFSKDYH